MLIVAIEESRCEVVYTTGKTTISALSYLCHHQVINEMTWENLKVMVKLGELQSFIQKISILGDFIFHRMTAEKNIAGSLKYY